VFDSVASALLTPDDIHTAPRFYDKKDLDEIHAEAKCRALEYIRSTPAEEYGVHPLGFLNIPLSESRTHRIRIHIWYRTMFAASSPYKIHDHSYSSYSIVLAGHLRHFTYAETSFGASGTDEFIVAQAAPGMTNTTLQMTNGRVHVAEVGELNLTSGSAYGLARDVFHYAEAMTDFVVTLYFHLRHADSRGLSRVAIPVQSANRRPLGRFEYKLLDEGNVLSLASAVADALS